MAVGSDRAPRRNGCLGRTAMLRGRLLRRPPVAPLGGHQLPSEVRRASTWRAVSALASTESIAIHRVKAIPRSISDVLVDTTLRSMTSRPVQSFLKSSTKMEVPWSDIPPRSGAFALCVLIGCSGQMSIRRRRHRHGGGSSTSGTSGGTSTAGTGGLHGRRIVHRQRAMLIGCLRRLWQR